jgi:hypothetical protein
MDAGIATAIGVALAAGFNAWAAALVFGLLARVFPGLLSGPVAALLASGPVLTVLLVLFGSEFLFDKIPWLDRLWNLSQTFLRPAVGGILALACMAAHGPWQRLLAAILGAAVTLLAHFAETASRFTSTAAISGWSQLALSLAEDVIAVSLTAVAVFSPGLSLGAAAAVVLLVVILFSRVRHGVAILFFSAAHPRTLRRAHRERQTRDSRGE